MVFFMCCCIVGQRCSIPFGCCYLLMWSTVLIHSAMYSTIHSAKEHTITVYTCQLSIVLLLHCGYN